MDNAQKKAAFFALLAAALYAISSPFSKPLLENIPPAMMGFSISERAPVCFDLRRAGDCRPHLFDDWAERDHRSQRSLAQQL